MHAVRRSTFTLMGMLLIGCGGTPATPSQAPATANPTQTPISTPMPSAMPSTTPGATTASQLPSFADDEPLVAFALRTDLGGGIFVMRPDGSGRTQLATDVLPGVHKSPDWSPDGQRVVFVDEAVAGLRIAHLDGSLTEVVEACRQRVCDDPAWSPDGTRIAFTSNESKDGVVAPSASEILVLTIATGAVESAVRLERPLLAQAARWSPDGTEIVIQVDRMDAEAYETGAAIAVVPLAGGDPQYLTEFDVFAGGPDWGWQTDEIAYEVGLQDLQRIPPGDAVAYELFGIRPDGTGLRQITSLGGGARLHAPRWAPDGLTIQAKQYDHGAGGSRLIDPTKGAVTPWLTGLEEARPLIRPLPSAT